MGRSKVINNGKVDGRTGHEGLSEEEEV